MTTLEIDTYLILAKIFFEPGGAAGTEGGTGSQGGGAASGTDEFFQKVGNMLTSFRESTQAIVIPLGALCIAFCAFQIISAGNTQETSRAKSWLIGIVIGMALWFFAPTLAATIASLAQS